MYVCIYDSASYTHIAFVARKSETVRRRLRLAELHLFASNVALKRAVWLKCCTRSRRLLGAGVLGDSLGSFADSVLGQLSRQQQANGSLDFATGNGRTSVVVGQTRCLRGDALEDVVDEAVHDRHRLAADTRVRVDLLQHLVDVDSVALSSPALLLLVSGANGFRLTRRFLRSLASWLRWHDFSRRTQFTRRTVRDALYCPARE